MPNSPEMMELENEAINHYDVLAVDAFSSDSIPVHLLTDEAMDIYLDHLKPDGIIALHISNRYLDLKPVLVKVAQQKNLQFGLIADSRDEEPPYLFSSHWLLMSRERDVLDKYTFSEMPLESARYVDARVWTHQLSDLLDALQ